MHISSEKCPNSDNLDLWLPFPANKVKMPLNVRYEKEVGERTSFSPGATFLTFLFLEVAASFFWYSIWKWKPGFQLKERCDSLLHKIALGT